MAHSYTTHSRESSAASSTFSIRSHGHWPSSGSSTTSAPDSPIMTKSPLGDLVEDEEEREDFTFDDPPSLPIDDALCMCDTTFCPHQPRVARSVTVPTAQMEWSAGDDATLSRHSSKRRKSSEFSRDSMSSKFSRRFPSISRRWRDSQPTTSLSDSRIHTASPARSSSLRLPKVRNALSSALSVRSRTDRSSSMSTPREYVYEYSHQPLDITAPPTPIEKDPIDRLEMSRTPLLPPVMHGLHSQSDDHVYSPLQSPSFAPSAASSVIQSPVSAPVGGLATPPLSAQPSYASFHRLHDVPPMNLQQEETDFWALRLGHANFDITPEPYLPSVCTGETCKQLLDSWEAARTEYMRQAAYISEEYGPNSHTFKLTEEKWSEIDSIWRSNYELANMKAGASGESLVYQPLAQTAMHQKMPSLENANADPDQPAKFPVVHERDIVGPMVQYAKINHTPTKKPGLLRIFTDPASLLTKTPFMFKR
ncbi:hypothetical protein AMS68_003465 [Peltaster fructicola]|uniref:Only prolin and serin are matching in the corresponding protein n=1 Tax=Peltaster fructicola TaxID=286661 RepID=A0A6H0XTK9_9PEZI|nr:hypothetical protein AMS68_003465 [Peltaster fructicola]